MHRQCFSPMRYIHYILLLSTLALASCGGGGGGNPPVDGGENNNQGDNPTAQTLSFNDTGPISLLLNDTLTNTASGQGLGIITYTSSDTNILAVDTSGTVTAEAVGQASITADIAADNQFRAAAASYIVNVVQETDPLPPTYSNGGADFDEGELDASSNGGTITFQNIGAQGWYPSHRNPNTSACDAYNANGCCLDKQEVNSDQLTPWGEDLILTLRGPMNIKQMMVYQPAAESTEWQLVSNWDERSSVNATGFAFHGNGTEEDFLGSIGTECLVDVSTDQVFNCGYDSVPFCESSSVPKHYGWSGSKLFVLLAAMPHADEFQVGQSCSNNSDGNWWDAPWIGLSLGELVRAGAFSDCHCYSKNPEEWWLADGCGQFNVFEVVNDNNNYRNLDIFSTNFFSYAGYVGEGPCGNNCDVTQLGAEADLINKSNSMEATQGAVANPNQGPGAAFRRPTKGYRYFIILLDVPTRTIQLATVHPESIPPVLAPLLPSLPNALSEETINDLLNMRLPQ